PHSSSSRFPLDLWISSGGFSFVGTRYSPPAHLPRSSNLQRSLQNGRYGLPEYSVSLLQVGHFIVYEDNSNIPPRRRGYSPLHNPSNKVVFQAAGDLYVIETAR